MTWFSTRRPKTGRRSLTRATVSSRPATLTHRRTAVGPDALASFGLRFKAVKDQVWDAERRTDGKEQFRRCCVDVMQSLVGHDRAEGMSDHDACVRAKRSGDLRLDTLPYARGVQVPAQILQSSDDHAAGHGRPERGPRQGRQRTLHKLRRVDLGEGVRAWDALGFVCCGSAPPQRQQVLFEARFDVCGTVCREHACGFASWAEQIGVVHAVQADMFQVRQAGGLRQCQTLTQRGQPYLAQMPSTGSVLPDAVHRHDLGHASPYRS